MSTHRFAGLLGSVVAAAVAVVTTALPAAGHATLQETDPAQGTRVDALPRTVTLTFDEPVGTPAFVEVTGPGEADAATGTVRIRDENVSRRLVRDAEPGRYSVAYRVTSADGHTITGSWRFTLSGAGGSDDGSGQAPAAEPTETQAAPETDPGSPGTTQAQPTGDADPVAAQDDDGGLGTTQLLLLLAALAVGLVAIGLGTRRALRQSAAMVDTKQKGGPRRR